MVCQCPVSDSVTHSLSARESLSVYRKAVLPESERRDNSPCSDDGDERPDVDRRPTRASDTCRAAVPVVLWRWLGRSETLDLACTMAK